MKEALRVFAAAVGFAVVLAGLFLFIFVVANKP